MNRWSRNTLTLMGNLIRSFINIFSYTSRLIYISSLFSGFAPGTNPGAISLRKIFWNIFWKVTGLLCCKPFLDSEGHTPCRAPWKFHTIQSGTSLCWGAAIRLTAEQNQEHWYAGGNCITRGSSRGNNGTSVIRGPATMKAGRWDFYGPVRHRHRLG